MLKRKATNHYTHGCESWRISVIDDFLYFCLTALTSSDVFQNYLFYMRQANFLTLLRKLFPYCSYI